MSRIDQAWQRASFPLKPRRPADDSEGGADVRPHTRPQLTPFDGAFDRKLVVSPEADARAVDEYRRLAAALESLEAERRRKTLLVTSAAPGEGKTLTAANVALTLSESCGRRVLLVDANVYDPSLHNVFRVANRTGLSHVLQREGADLPLAHVSANLSILTAGRPDSSTAAALTSDRMQDVVERAAADFEWVLLDAAAASAMRDIQLLARIAGAVLLVIQAKRTRRVHVRAAIHAIGRGSVVGAVLNRRVD